MAEQGLNERDLSPWGKVGVEKAAKAYPLLFHLLDTAAVALELWERFLSPNQRAAIAGGLGVEEGEARLLVAFWAGLHDLGKLTPGFQQCVAEAYAELSQVLQDDVGEVDAMRHERASMHCALGLLGDLGYGVDTSRGAGVRVAQILGGHHGRFQPVDLQRVMASGEVGADDGLGGREWGRQREKYVGVLRQLLNVPAAPREVNVPSAVLITGLVILADWLVSQEHYWRPLADGPAVSAEEHFARAVAAAPELVAAAGLLRVRPERKGFAEAYGIEKPNPLQSSILEELESAVDDGAGGLLVVTAGTGDGKTETGLVAEGILADAAGTSGLCFVLPTMATSNEMYKRVARVVDAQSGPTEGATASMTLTHSMAWLNEAYTDSEVEAGVNVISDESRGTAIGTDGRRTRPVQWLRGPKRPLLAQYAVGTIDQSLLSVLPVKHSALRMLALSGKTFVVDEAHAYDPYMQVLLARLLQWLGAYRCPVVLLSATLPSSVGERLIRSYLAGAGHGKRSLRRLDFRPPYPGWLYVDASTAKRSVISATRQREQGRERAYALTVETRPVRYIAEADDGQQLPSDSRLAVIADVLGPLARDGGAAAVVCNTVADAQGTYDYLKRRFSLRAGEEIVLLHARFPADQREAATSAVVEALGRTGRPPADRLIVVATQVIEQSLDLDADLIVSDLAPIAQLLQRAGRCWRHEEAWRRGGQRLRERLRWARDVGPRLVVLDPLNEDQEPPRHWGSVYAPYLLSATSECLHGLPQAGGPGTPTRIEVPERVQELVERVHGAESRFEAETEQLEAQLTDHQAETMAQRHLGEAAAVPGPGRVGGLHDLHRENVDEVEAATRLGAESVRVLGCHLQPDGRRTLDVHGEHPLPAPVRGRFGAADVRAVMRRTFPLRAGLLKERGSDQEPPPSWREHSFLGELVLLVHEVTTAGAVNGVQVGSEYFRLDPELGLIHRRI
ncbi:CRISPR-associated helicase Cas3' [Streptomyces sp. NPDC051569]|uniref:CRISPR-associated helicase Cas3' n=1 Tax=Streptomyces sp. NPDC051569 TaxID=3365661 RepID=UPI00379C37CE